jgi:pseudouridine kinase
VSEAEILCIGGAVVDRTYRLAGPLQAGTSNPATALTSYGGVARNLAENLARMGRRVGLISAVGDDAAGEGLVAHLAGLGVETSLIVRIHGAATSDYCAILDPAGELAVAVANLALLEESYGALAERATARLAETCWLFADCNAPAEGLAWLIAAGRAAGVSLAIDAISAPKACRLPVDLTGVSLLFLNRDEAASALGVPADTDPDTMAGALIDRGAGTVVLTLGAEGALADDGATRVRQPSLAREVRDVTGAGDANMAGVLHARMAGENLVTSLRLGAMMAARLLALPGGSDPALGPAHAVAMLAQARE